MFGKIINSLTGGSQVNRYDNALNIVQRAWVS